MLRFELVIAAVLAYAALLFAIAWAADRRAARGRGIGFSPAVVYTLALSVYCTAWTFYGAAGYAARSGLEYVTIYLGPTLVMTGWWAILRRMVRVGREARITSIADMISSRFGRSEGLAALVTVLAVVAVTPYVALQLQSVTLSLAVFAEAGAWGTAPSGGLWVAGVLAIFTILFGTRNIDVNERHHGVMAAIAVEAVVKLLALSAVGIFVIWQVAGGPAGMIAMIEDSPVASFTVPGSRWAGLTALSALAFLTLPRMFHVLVVENARESHLAIAGWAFPAYLLGMSAFVLPITVAGLAVLPDGTNADLFVLTLPLEQGRGGLALLAFIGGLSSATSMVILATIALATMVSNHIVLPLWLSVMPLRTAAEGDIRSLLLTARRVSVLALLALGYLYYRVSGGGVALASIGTVAFVGIAQIAPALLAGLYWRGATPAGAVAGLMAGFALWVWCLLAPSAGLTGADVLSHGPFSIGWLRPQAMFGAAGMDADMHAALWSLAVNSALLVGVSLAWPQRVQRPEAEGPAPAAVDLLAMAQRLLGARAARDFFDRAARAQGLDGLPEVTPEFLERLERLMAGSVGAAAAHAMMVQMTGRAAALSVEDLFAVADEAAQIMEYSARLEAKSREQARTSEALRSANRKLTDLARQKDAFLGQVSHELRTPMTSIRAFSELLVDSGLSADERRRFAGIIRDEAKRLTRLLDDLLDLSVLESGHAILGTARVQLSALLDRAVDAGLGADRRLRVQRHAGEELWLMTDGDRLAQVFINLISNAAKYCDAEMPELRIVCGRDHVDFIDNGSGIPAPYREAIFEKFVRVDEARETPGAGLGLAICREIMQRLGGSVSYLPGQGGAAFRVMLPGVISETVRTVR